MFSNKESPSVESPSDSEEQTEIEHIFHTAVPYRISQILKEVIILLRECADDFDVKAPKVLAIKKNTSIFTPQIQDLKTLSFGDKIFVQKYKTKSVAISSTDKVVMNQRFGGKNYIGFEATVTSASFDSSLITCSDLAHISSLSGEITARNEINSRKVSSDIWKGIPLK